jgi:hypothetical protein
MWPEVLREDMSKEKAMSGDRRFDGGDFKVRRSEESKKTKEAQ